MAVKDGGNRAKDGRVFLNAAEELCKRALKREENKVAQCWNRNDEQDGKSKQEKERKKNVNEGEGQVEELGSRLEKSVKSSDYW